VDMGFDLKTSKAALKHAKNDIEKAIDYIREGTFTGELEVDRE
jgi:hypothetical protein